MSIDTDDPKAHHREPSDGTTTTVRGTTVPKLGYGTWQVTGQDAEDGVADALQIGYRHIDTARAYGNEAEVGKGLKAGGVDRSDVFLTTKVFPGDFGREQLIAAAEDSLQQLQTDYVDLLLLHWPDPEVELAETLGAMVELKDRGLIRNLGVSNFPSRLVEEALQHAPVFANQVEFHPYLGQPQLLAQARRHDLLLEAYSPFAHGHLHDDETLKAIGEAHGKSAGQVALRWLLDQPQVVTLPKASSHERREENFAVFDFELTEDERAQVAGLERGMRTADPSFAPDWD